MVSDEVRLKVVLPERLNGLRRTGRGVYVATQESIRAELDKFIPGLDSLPARYVPQGNEKQRLEIARKNGNAVLLSGPTGVGKSLLVYDYAAENGLPLLVFTANEDATDWKMRGSLAIHMIPAMDEEGRMHDLKVQVFSHAQVAMAAMADRPVILFIDELHKIREGVTSLLHSIANPTERKLYCYEMTGEYYKLHPESMLVGALNPSYGEGGIDRLDAALRRRLPTIHLDMPGQETVVKIVLANFKKLDPKTVELVKKLAEVQAAIVTARSGVEERSPSAVVDARLDTQTLSSIIESPSPASIVETIRAVTSGLPVMDAVEMYMVNTIVTDFGHARRALISYVDDKLPKSLKG